MTNAAVWDRIPVIISFAEAKQMVETYGFAGSQGQTVLEGQRLVPRDRPSDTVYVFMHPATTLHLLPMPTALAGAGLHVLCCGSRYAKNDSPLIMEKVAYDLGAIHPSCARGAWLSQRDTGRMVRRRLAVAVLSGAGRTSDHHAHAGRRPLRSHPGGVARADGIIFIAAHLSRAETLTEWIDPSVRDELDPDRRDPALDIYDANCPDRPPFSRDFVATFRAAQLARNRRITDWALDRLDFLRKKNDGEMERGFVVHRTMCDVRWIDASIDPNGRKPNWCYLGDPRIANSAPAGLARYSSLRSWLSQWSYDTSNAKGSVNAALVKQTPVLQIVNQADDAVPATHNPAIRAALATGDKEYVEIMGATHYYSNQPEQLSECLAAVTGWSRRKGLLAV